MTVNIRQVGDPVLRAMAEIGRKEARPDGVVEYGAAADAVEVEHAHVGLAEVDWIVRPGAARAGERSPVLERCQLPVPFGAAVILGRMPATLLERDDR